MEPHAAIIIRGEECYLLIPKAREAMDRLESGQILRVVTDGSGSVLDFDVFCKFTGARIMSHAQQDDDHIFLIKKRQ